MTPGARLQAAIELLAAIESSTSPADRVSAGFFRSRRYMGGGDRRDVIDRAYRVLRRRAPVMRRNRQRVCISASVRLPV